MLATTAENVDIRHPTFLALKKRQVDGVKAAWCRIANRADVDPREATDLQAELQKPCSMFDYEDRQDLALFLTSVMAKVKVPVKSRAQTQVNVHIQNYGNRDLSKLLDDAESLVESS